MLKRLIVLGVVLTFVLILTGCSKEAEADQQELMDAQNLIMGLTMMTTMTGVNPGPLRGDSGPTALGPPFGWTGPEIFALPEGDDSIYYKFVLKFPLDSIGVTIDSLIWLFKFTPDIWDSDYQDSIATGFDTWLIGETRDDIYFHTVVDIPDTTHVIGEMKWNWTATWWQYAFDNSTIDEAAEIDITSSDNIRISAHFLFDEVGAGELEDNWGKFQTTTFVKYKFFAATDTSGYDGYYQLLSEDWKVDHYFTLTN